MIRRSLIAVFLLLLDWHTLLSVMVGLAEVKMAPLPSTLLTCKKVYLIDESGDLAVFDHLYDKLTKWGRWEVVQKKQDAEVILIFSKQQTYYGAVNTGSVVVNPRIGGQSFSSLMNSIDSFCDFSEHPYTLPFSFQK
jgi:hypothetical protein